MNDLEQKSTEEKFENDDLRQVLDAAFEEHATDEVRESEPTNEQRTRDERGRFAERGRAAATPKAESQTQELAGNQSQDQATAPTPPPQPTEIKAPASWKPEVREKWQALDPVVRQEVHRREGEMQQVLQQSAAARQFVDAFERVAQPYEMFIRAENSNPLQAFQNLMQTAAELRVGTPQSKAQLVAGMIKQYAVDVEMLDSLLAGSTQGVQQQVFQQQQQFRDPRLDQFLAQQQQFLSQQNQQQDAHIRQTLNAFAESHEFYQDVAGLMADLIEARTKRGEQVDIEKIYKQACQMHDGVSTILTQRETAQKSSSNSAAVLRAKRAAVSVKGDSTPEDGATVPKNDSVRAAIEAAMDAHSNA